VLVLGGVDRTDKHTSSRDEAGYVVVVEAVNTLEIPGGPVSLEKSSKRTGIDLHLPTSPLYFLHNVETAVHDELIHMSCLLREPCDAISTLLSCSKLVLKERIVLSANNGKVIRHCCRVLFMSGSFGVGLNVEG
jgi:hypothetical protein